MVGGHDRTRSRRRRIRDRRHELPHGPPRAGGERAARRPARVRDHAARTRALLTSYVVRNADLSSVGGPRNGTIQDAIFQEIDLASGELLLEWHSLEHIPLAESYAPVEANWDFFHINSVDLDGDGNLLVSARSTHTVYKLDRNGAIIWRLGGKRSDFDMGAGASFAWQHDARRQPDGTMTVFDNGATPAVEKRSRALILDVDEAVDDSDAARRVHPPQRSSRAARAACSCWTTATSSSAGEKCRAFLSSTTRGTSCSTRVLGHKYECYRAFRLPWTGMPADAPAIALAGSGRHRTAYASWNGATEVRDWQLLAGSEPGALIAGRENARPRLRDRVACAHIGPVFRGRGAGRLG